MREKLEWIPIGSNPVRKAKRVGSAKIKGHHTWAEAEIAQYQRIHPLGSKAKLYLETILWTGQRRGDARLFGPRHIVDGKVNYKASKTDADLWLPLARDLQRAIAAMPKVGIRTYLATEYGEPCSKDGMGNAVREWCDAADLPHCTSHSLRKAVGRRMAQLRLTEEEMIAVGGWRDTQSLRVYTEAVEQEWLADGALKRVDDAYATKEPDDG